MGVTVVNPKRCGCGAALASGGAWCTQCWTAVPQQRFAPAPDRTPAERAQQQFDGLRRHRERTRRPERGRFDATEVTFGPRGRLVATALLLTPLAWWVVGGVGIGTPILVLFYLLALPWALRDVWRRSDRL